MEENGDNILDALFDGEIGDDVDMADTDAIEEGEIEEDNQCIQFTEPTDVDSNMSERKMRRRRAKKKKNKKKKSGSVSSVDNINRFVIDTCRQLKERKSYLIWNAVGCLGVSAVRDLVKEIQRHGLPKIWLWIGRRCHVDDGEDEGLSNSSTAESHFLSNFSYYGAASYGWVDAIQACGGQMTADGHPRNGGGILWNILKTREPKAFKEIMLKGKEFEKQFRQPNARRGSDENNKVLPSEKMVQAPVDHIKTEVSDELMSQTLDDSAQRNSDAKRISVLKRIRVPVAYDDLIREDTKDETL
ncbi:hypothetical protein Sjap_019484 [Stephania japonica]|uniref:Phosphorylated adapter RNA export protein n=1 Tax=Stephania japonica TaxID=461633 RepID=A0AAP0F1L5_9MAGN